MDDEREDVAAKGPSALTDEYHKARHTLAIFSGILLAWETAGLGVGEKVTVVGTEFSLKNPKGIPILLVMVIVYCWFRLGVEWWQCDVPRRDKSPSIIDLVAAYAIGMLAVTLSGLQQFTSFKLAEAFTLTTAAGVGIGFFVLAPIVVRGVKWIHEKLKTEEREPSTEQLWTILSGSGIAALLGFIVGLWPPSRPFLAFGMVIGSSVHGFVVGMLAGRRKDSPAWWTILGWIPDFVRVRLSL